MGNRTSGKWCLYCNPGMEIFMYIIPVIVVIMVVYWLLQTKEWFPDTWLNPFIIQDNTGTVLLQFGVVIIVGLALSRFFNTKTAKGAMKDNKAAK